MEDFNTRLFQLIFGVSGKNPLFDNLGIFIAEYLPYFLVIGVLAFLFFENSWRKRVAIFSELTAVVILSRGIIAEIIRFIYPHLRPPLVLRITSLIGDISGNSFPSGHAAFFFALATALYFINEKWGKWYFLFAALNGIARIFVGVHWPLDILAGAAVGIFSGLAVHYLFKPYMEKINEAAAKTN